MPLSFLIATFVVIDHLLLGDPLSIRTTGTAYVALLIIFLVGLVLFSQGIISLYLSHIHTETKNRPLFIVNKRRSTIELETL